MEEYQKCMRCHKEVEIDFQKSLSKSEKPILKGYCPECNGVNIRRLPSEKSNIEDSKDDIPENEQISSNNVSEGSGDISEPDQELPDITSEESQKGPSQTSSSDSLSGAPDNEEAYEDGFLDGYREACLDIVEQSTEENQESTPLEGSSESVTESPEEITEEADEMAVEGSSAEKQSGISPIFVVVIILFIAMILTLWLTSQR